MMPSKGKKFIHEFLMPNLNNQRFGTRLKWLNTEYLIFQVQWNHKSASGWTKDDAEVFMEWDKMKGRLIPDDKERFTKSKQRFRAIMYKLIKGGHITEICCRDKFTKIYYFGKDYSKKGENIPKEVIIEALDSRENTFCEISSERMDTCDPEAVMDINEIPAGSFVTDNQIKEDHKYAILTSDIKLESEDKVPDNYLKELNYCEDTQCMYVNVIQGNLLSNKQGTYQNFEDGGIPDLNDYAALKIQCEVPENHMYEEYVCVPEELFQTECLLPL